MLAVGLKWRSCGKYAHLRPLTHWRLDSDTGRSWEAKLHAWPCRAVAGGRHTQDRNRALFYLLVHRPLRPVPHWLSALGITIFPDVALGRASDGVPRPVAGLTEQEEGLGRIRRQENTGLSKPHDSGLFINTPRSLVVTDCITDYANSKECKTCFSKLNSWGSTTPTLF